MGQHLPLILVEVIMVFGGALAFGWWQLRSIRKDREKAAANRQAQQARQSADQAAREGGPDAA
jgi:predicted negative regulator of RcsB-dependent stress response